MAAFFTKMMREGPGVSTVRGMAEGRPSKREVLEKTVGVKPRFPGGAEAQLDADGPYRPAFATWATSPKNPFFARAMVNRTWARFFGRGLTNSLENDHLRAAYHTHTGHRPIVGGTVFPSIGSIVSKELGKSDFPLPSYAVVCGANTTRVNQGTQSGYLGAKHQPLLIREPKLGVENLKAACDPKQFDQRMSLLNQVESGFYKDYPVDPAEAYLTTLNASAQMMRSKEARAYDLSLEPAAVRAQYGNSGYGDACILARRLVEVGLPFVEVSMPEWDNHAGYDLHKKNLPPLDAAMSALILDLKDRGLLDRTLIVVMGEFGRGGVGKVGPDAKSKENRGHWHKACSTALIGGGIKGGQVIGKTDQIAATVEDRPVTIADFFATICTILGVDYTKEYTEPGGRPIRIVDKGEKPLTELL